MNVPEFLQFTDEKGMMECCPWNPSDAQHPVGNIANTHRILRTIDPIFPVRTVVKTGRQ